MSQERPGIVEAKRSLGQQFRSLDGFVGIGIGDGDIRLYVVDSTVPAAEYFKSHIGKSYRGYPVSLVLSPGFRATAPLTFKEQL